MNKLLVDYVIFIDFDDLYDDRKERKKKATTEKRKRKLNFDDDVGPTVPVEMEVYKEDDDVFYDRRLMMKFCKQCSLPTIKTAKIEDVELPICSLHCFTKIKE